MTIIELGALGELLGAIAVVLTLIYLSVQVRHSRELLEANRVAIEEGARFARVAAMDRHNDAVSRWRGRLIENEEVALIWHKAMEGGDLDDVGQLRLQNLFVDWVNTYRSNFRHATMIGDDGLARQAILTVSEALERSPVLREHWDMARSMNELAAMDFVTRVENEQRSPLLPTVADGLAPSNPFGA
jgi:hypothetical protein